MEENLSYEEAGLVGILPEPASEDLGNCPNCGEIVVRELVYQGVHPNYYWPCTNCGYHHHGAEIPALD